MDFVTDIDTPVLHWIQKVTSEESDSSQHKLWGVPVAGTHGFGPNDKRYFHGTLAAVSQTEDWQQDAVGLGEGHSTRKGFYLTIQTQEPTRLPQPPFLVSSHTEIRFVREQQVAFEPAKDWAELDSDSHKEDYVLCCPQFIGILRVDTARSNRQGSLLIFSDQPQVKLAAKQKLMFADDPEEEFATVTPLAKSHTSEASAR